jgi:shikimate dehydrogenase
MTDRYAVIGNPVSHSRSPWIHTEFARATKQDILYDRLEAPLDGFVRAVDAFRAAGGKGLNVTVPFKEQAFRYCAETSGQASAAQAVNTLVFGEPTYGDNTDGVGLVRDLTENLGIALRGVTVVLMGAGGAAQGVVGALLEAGVSRLTVANRTPGRAEALAERFRNVEGCGYLELAGKNFDLVVNATSAGLSGEASPLPPGVLGRNSVAYDMVYGRETAFLAAARTAGARVCDGVGMLVEQAAESFFIWRGVRPDTRPVLNALRGS